MRYQGGKSRISKQISYKIKKVTNAVSRWQIKNCKENSEHYRLVLNGGCFVSLFCGTCSIESKLSVSFGKMILNDKHKYLIDLLVGVQNGYELPEFISEEQYKYIRKHKDEDNILTGFVGFGCSFGGKWFGGYARNKTNTNYALQSKKSLLKDMSTLQAACFTCQDYKDVKLPEGCVIYADPPYNNTTGYGNEKFDSSEFWEYAREASKEHLMFISEQEAPDDFVVIWECPFTRTLDKNKQNQFKVTEKLFIHKNWLKQLNNDEIN